MSTSPTLKKLTQPVRFIKGVGAHKAKLLDRLGLKTAADVLFFFPRKYQDFREITPVADLEPDQLASLLVEVVEVESAMSRTGKHILYVLFKDETDFVRGIWFGQGFLKDRFKIDQKVLLRGKVAQRGTRFQLTHPKVTWLESGQEVTQGQLLPVYRMTEGTNQRQLRDIVKTTIEEYASLVEEAMPPFIRERAEVCDIQTAIQNVHFPDDQEQLDEARGRLCISGALDSSVGVGDPSAPSSNQSTIRFAGVDAQSQITNPPKISF